MKKGYKLVCSDIDGTLVNSENRMCPTTAEVVRRVVDQGVIFALISARPPVGMFYLLDDMGIDQYVVAFGGSIILKRGQKPVYEDTLPMEYVERLREESRKFGLNLSVYSGEDLFVEKIDERVRIEQQIARAVPIELPFREIKKRAGNPNKLLYLGDPEAIAAFEQWAAREYDGLLAIYRSKPDYLEVCPPQSTKYGGMMALADHLGIDPSEIMAIGDNYNDVDMLKGAAFGVAMGNAPEDVKKAADFVTLPCMEDGVGYALQKFIL